MTPSLLARSPTSCNPPSPPRDNENTVTQGDVEQVRAD